MLTAHQGRVVLNEGGFSQWLEWLQRAQQQLGIVFSGTSDPEELFVSGQAAYLVAKMSRLDHLRAELGEKQVGVAPLPAGPQGEAGPFLIVEALVLDSELDEAQIPVVLEFAKYVASEESLSLLMEQASYIPANVKVDTSADPAIATFLEQAQTAIPWPAVKEFNAVESFSRMLTEEVLDYGYDPQSTVDGFADFVNKMNGFDVESLPCVGEGQVMLWHSWCEEKAATLDQIID